jgi:hypothetical protein
VARPEHSFPRRQPHADAAHRAREHKTFTVADRVFARTCARTHALRYNQGMLYEKERRLPEAIAVYKEIAVAHPT